MQGSRGEGGGELFTITHPVSMFFFYYRYYKYCLDHGYVNLAGTVVKDVENEELTRMDTSFTEDLGDSGRAEGTNYPTDRKIKIKYQMEEDEEVLEEECARSGVELIDAAEIDDMPDEIGRVLRVKKPCSVGECFLTYFGQWRSSEWVDRHCADDADGDVRTVKSMLAFTRSGEHRYLQGSGCCPAACGINDASHGVMADTAWVNNVDLVETYGTSYNDHRFIKVRCIMDQPEPNWYPFMSYGKWYWEGVRDEHYGDHLPSSAPRSLLSSNLIDFHNQLQSQAWLREQETKAKEAAKARALLRRRKKRAEKIEAAKRLLPSSDVMVATELDEDLEEPPNANPDSPARDLSDAAAVSSDQVDDAEDDAQEESGSEYEDASGNQEAPINTGPVRRSKRRRKSSTSSSSSSSSSASSMSSSISSSVSSSTTSNRSKRQKQSSSTASASSSTSSTASASSASTLSSTSSSTTSASLSSSTASASSSTSSTASASSASTLSSTSSSSISSSSVVLKPIPQSSIDAGELDYGSDGSIFSSFSSETPGPVTPDSVKASDLEVMSSGDDDSHSGESKNPTTPVSPVSPVSPEKSPLGDDGLMVDDTVLSTMELPESKTVTGTRQSKRRRTRKRKLVNSDSD